jgi:hypothetical protein
MYTITPQPSTASRRLSSINCGNAERLENAQENVRQEDGISYFPVLHFSVQ